MRAWPQRKLGAWAALSFLSIITLKGKKGNGMMPMVLKMGAGGNYVDVGVSMFILVPERKEKNHATLDTKLYDNVHFRVSTFVPEIKTWWFVHLTN